MARMSRIEWTEATWNPVTGCTKISIGCEHCYAERMANRLRAMGSPNYSRGFEVTLQPQALEIPLAWRRPHTVFVNSMGDLFHEAVPFEFIEKVFGVMARARWHHFQVLTKRGHRFAELCTRLDWPENVWMGVTVEAEEYLYRVDSLRGSEARVKFLSLEPLLGPVPEMDLAGIDWVIVGGESGPGSRPMRAEWLCDIRDQCLEAGVPFFFKQWGGVFKKRNGRILDGRTWDQFPRVAIASTLRKTACTTSV